MVTVMKLNRVNYQDVNGYTALHKAVSACQLNVIREIGHSRPVLKGICDNVSSQSILLLLPVFANQLNEGHSKLQELLCKLMLT